MSLSTRALDKKRHSTGKGKKNREAEDPFPSSVLNGIKVNLAIRVLPTIDSLTSKPENNT